MLLVNVHQLDVVLADSVTVGALKDKVDNIGRVLGLEGEDILVLSSAENLLQRYEVDAEGDVTVASEGREGVGLEQHGDKGDVRIVHGLEADTGVVTFKVAVLDKVLDGFDDLLQKVGLFETCLKHCGVVSLCS